MVLSQSWCWPKGTRPLETRMVSWLVRSIPEQEARVLASAAGDIVYGLLTKREDKMAAYWQSSFLRVYA